ncbi:lysophospholipase L1-like esterase [Novosphingobium sp. SG751A]|uniref:SGNH/GDSL hydrolase family protein n=1 Tax=Novosphingobium sp. SG751A TaxID=2587000 RepID=UPI0015517263|nr:SGNH/GDSL hydrolase family protein [Novosphingobium sp. SG751A]NOW49013.1 lysophospholipase L1-like esterase [Novosphingobium sp. SG751A]
MTSAVAVALALSSGATQAKPVWREAFQSSPATYEAASESFVKFAVEHWHLPADKLRLELTPQPVSGTVRYRITVQTAGSKLRIRLSNEEGTAPLRLSAASVGVAGDAFAARLGSLHALTFGGAAGVTIPVGAPVLSDPVDLAVKPGAELIVSAALASPMMNEGRGGAGFLIAPGNQAMQTALDQAAPMKGRPLVTGVSVLSEAPPHVIVALGDSITDGNKDRPDALHGWPEVLARRLTARKGGGRYTVLNAGIAGNRVLSPGWGAASMARLDRDALRIDGLTHLILLEGINDINFSGHSLFDDHPDITAEELIAGYRQIIARAHARSVKIYLGTLTPNPFDPLTSTPAKVAMREAVNHWIRTSREPDAVIDFEAMVRDPAKPTQFKPEFDSGDHLHPSDKGHQAMGNGIDLSLFP